MSERLYENVVTVRIVSEQPIPPGTPLADLSYRCATHFFALQSVEIRSRQMTVAESNRLDPARRAQLGDEPDPGA